MDQGFQRKLSSTDYVVYAVAAVGAYLVLSQVYAKYSNQMFPCYCQQCQQKESYEQQAFAFTGKKGVQLEEPEKQLLKIAFGVLIAVGLIYGATLMMDKGQQQFQRFR